MQTVNANVQNRILALVKMILEQNSIAVEVHPDSRLVDIGLTSMDMVNLMLSVEAEFDFTIPQSEITPDNFQTTRTLELMILNQLKIGTVPDLHKTGELRETSELRGRTNSSSSP